jgi:hypothetical protein
MPECLISAPADKMRTQYQLRTEITSLENRQKDIEFMLNNRRVIVDDEWRIFVSEIKGEHTINAERIGNLQSQLKLLKLETT